MKKVIYLLLTVVIVSVYACQKDNTVPAGKAVTTLSLKGKKDTVPPDPSFTTQRIKKDTVPPDPRIR
jgi:hypothetical protein